MTRATETRRFTSPLPQRLERRRLTLQDGRRTTLHVARYPLAGTRVSVVAFPTPRRLADWCREAGAEHAIVAGFFVRPEGTPLGELRIGGTPMDHEPFASPWGGRRGCVVIDGGTVSIDARPAFPESPDGDLLEAGPMLVRNGFSVLDGVDDPEGFSSASEQFDSDITRGRYPRAALGISPDELLAVACEGRASNEAGLSLAELAGTMARLGCRRAINLDGGGSTSLVFDGVLRNSPREEHGVRLAGGRPVATALVFEPRPH